MKSSLRSLLGLCLFSVLILGCSRKLGVNAVQRGNAALVPGATCSERLVASLQMSNSQASIQVGAAVQWELEAQGGCASQYKVSSSQGYQFFTGRFTYMKSYSVPTNGARESVLVTALDDEGRALSSVTAESAPFTIAESATGPVPDSGTGPIVIGIPVIYPPQGVPPSCSLTMQEVPNRRLEVRLQLRGTISRAFVDGIEVRPLPVSPANTAILYLPISATGVGVVRAEVHGPNGQSAVCEGGYQMPDVHPLIARCLGNWLGPIPFTYAELARPRIVDVNFTLNSSTIRTDRGTGRELVVVNVAIDRSSSNQFHLQNPEAWYCLNIDISMSSSNQVTYPCASKTAIANYRESLSSSNRVYCR